MPALSRSDQPVGPVGAGCSSHADPGTCLQGTRPPRHRIVIQAGLGVILRIAILTWVFTPIVAADGHDWDHALRNAASRRGPDAPAVAGWSASIPITEPVDLSSLPTLFEPPRLDLMQGAAETLTSCDPWIPRFSSSAGLSNAGWKRSRIWRAGDYAVIEYRQVYSNRPVLNGSIRLVVHESGRLAAVFAAGSRPDLEVSWPATESGTAMNDDEEFVRTDGRNSSATEGWWLDRSGDLTPVRWSQESKSSDTGHWVDVRTQESVQSISLVAHGSTEGRVRGSITAGFDAPFDPSDTFLSPLASLRVTISGAGTTITDANGQFSLDTSGASTVVTARLLGPFVSVVNDAGPNLESSAQTQPGVPATIDLGGAFNEEQLAQINAFIHTNLAHEWVSTIDTIPPFTALDFALQARVNDQSVGFCDARFDPSVPELVFRSQGGGCPNTAYSSIVYHEYGHAIAYEIFGTFFPGDMHEGIADAVSTLVSGAREVGRDFYGIDNPLRDMEDDAVFPVSGTIHQRGRVIACSFYDLRTRLAHQYGWDEGQRLTSKLFLESLQFIPTGISDAYVTTVLLADDDDGDLGNGTPHDEAIIESFQIHGLEAEPVFLEPVTALADQAAGSGWEFTWDLGAAYDEIEVERNGVLIELLAGDATSFVDSSVPPGRHTYLFRARVASVGSPATPRLIIQRQFQRGDLDSNGIIDLSDAVSWLTLDLSALGCQDVADINDDGETNLSDVVFLLEYLFTSGSPPSSPFSTLGEDTTGDLLPCAGER